MPVYTVHEPSRHDSDDDTIAHTSRFVFVRDGFHFWAFLLTPLWMLRHRLWLEFIAYAADRRRRHVRAAPARHRRQAGGWVALADRLLVGIEASSLRRWKLARRKFEQVGVVVADDLRNGRAALLRRLDRRTDERPAPASAAVGSASLAVLRRPPSTDIVGLFPQPEARP